MNNRFSLKKLSFNFDKNTFQLIYYRNKEFILPIVIIILCVFLFSFVVINQFQDFLLSKSQTEEINGKILVLKKNLSLLSGIAPGNQKTYLSVVGSALPAEKDFAGMLQAITTAAQNSNVGLSDFTLQIGDLSKFQNTTGGFSPLTVSFSIRSGPLGAKKFLNELSSTVPLSNIVSVQSGAIATNVVMEFYFKSASSIRVDLASPIRGVSAEEQKLLDMLTEWVSRTNSGGSFSSSSTNSALLHP